MEPLASGTGKLLGSDMPTLRRIEWAVCFLLATAGCRTTGTRDDPALARHWPPPLDERLVVGSWVRENAPIQNVPSYTLLQLKPDHTWATAHVIGLPDKPDRVADVVRGQLWGLSPPWPSTGGEVTRLRLMAWRDRPEGSDSSREIQFVTGDELLFGPTFNSIVVADRYRKLRDAGAIDLLMAQTSGGAGK